MKKRNTTQLILFGFLLLCFILVSSPQTTYSLAHFHTNAHIAYTTTVHDPIFIDGNQNFSFIASSEGWSGEGSSQNPYLIMGYEITSITAPLIEIKNTIVHFKINGSTLNGLSNKKYDGISLDNVSNACIMDNSIQKTYAGIRLNKVTNSSFSDNTITLCCNAAITSSNSDFNEITGNSLTNNGESGCSQKSMWEDLTGIYLKRSHSNLISDNNIENSWHTGITIDTSSWNTIEKNTIDSTDDEYGAGIWNYQGITEYNTFSENTIKNVDKALLVEERYFSHNIITRNTVFNNVDGIGVRGTNNTISYNTVYNNKDGIALGWDNDEGPDEPCVDNIIEFNKIYNNTNGLILDLATDCIIRNNSIFTNGKGMQILSASSGNTIKWNDFIANSVKDDGTNNIFTSNFWYEWTDITKPREISGTAENSDPSPVATKNCPDSPDIIPPTTTVAYWFIAPIFLVLIILARNKRKNRKI